MSRNNGWISVAIRTMLELLDAGQTPLVAGSMKADPRGQVIRELLNSTILNFDCPTGREVYLNLNKIDILFQFSSFNSRVSAFNLLRCGPYLVTPHSI